VTEELAALEEELVSAVRARDREAAAALLDDDFVLTSSLGTGLIVEREAWLDNLEAIETDELLVGGLVTHKVGDVGVVVSRMDWSARSGDDDLSGPYVVTDVWVGRRLAWRSWARLNAEFLLEELCR
jgi:Domain of unknown function (DUF4440)